jgi:hypothetical protein
MPIALLASLFKIPKKTWKCNVIGCDIRVGYSGEICAACETDVRRFKQIQENLDVMFKQLSNTDYLAQMLNYPIPKNESFESYFKEHLKMMLHRRDNEIADAINEIWKRKIHYQSLPILQ